MLKSIGLKNYKCFKKLKVNEKEEMAIKPLTVLCGVNSSGKSSLIKSMLMMKQSYEDNTASNFMTFNGKYTDNGSFNDILYENSSEKYFTITNEFEITQGENITKDSTNYRDLCRLFYDNNISKFHIKNSIQIIGIQNDDLINPNKISQLVITIDLFKNEHKVKTSKILIKLKEKNIYRIDCENMPDVSGNLGEVKISECRCYFSSMSLNSIYQKDMTSNTKLYIPSIVSISNIMLTQYSQIKYIAPLREDPKRHYIIDKNVNSVGITGEDTPLLLKIINNKKWSGICAPKTEENVSNLLSKPVVLKFKSILQSWLTYFELGVINLNGSDSDIVKIEINNHNIADVGFGVSQSLPILVEGLFMNPKQTLLLEQPEIHLHPKMQMKMADFLLSLAMQDKQMVVETHSDHFINRLVRRCIECEEFHEKVIIYFIDKDENNISNIQEIKIDKINGAICQNSNFFYQFASETEKIIDAGYNNLQKEK